ncbi:LysR family transcriptional regulator [Agarilytica rhodophyticola]|uniref:LysR family transcriptional regulator n=1 Tax=Agarilytica rhodophyticola TaxID=1737490 RepID=UPI000B3453F6|nr:LysR family transcriptional regulator [Agarilytica rhodophyticola]
MDTIKCMSTFVAVASQRSFTSGAKQIGISTKLASKYVQQLEERLGAQLFNRTTRNVTLTDTGQAYFDRCVPLLDQFDELEGLVQERQSELAGSIRITAPTGFGGKQLVEALRPFQLQHPKVLIDLYLSDHQISIIEEGFDLAIRFGGLKDSTLIARKLMDMRVVVIASPDYLAEHGEPTHPQALSGHNCLLQMASADPEHWKFCIDGNVSSFKVHGSFQANSPRAVVNMALGGLGIGMCPMYVVEPHVKKGRLKILFEDKEASELGLYAIYPQRRHLIARIRALIDHFTEVFEQYY